MSEPSSFNTSSYVLAKYPKWQDMDFGKNCSLYGLWLALYATAPQLDKSGVVGPSMMLTPALVNQALPADFTLPANESQPALGTFTTELNTWFYENMVEFDEKGDMIVNEDFLGHVIIDPIGNCQVEYCKAIGLIGNPDMTGIGVMITYYIGAILATAYLIAFTIERCKQSKKRSAQSQGRPLRAATFARSGSKRLLEAFHGSFFGYITAAMMLSVSMLIAGMFVAVQGIRENNVPDSEMTTLFTGTKVYDISLSMLSCLFSICPILVGYCFLRAPEQGQGAFHKIWLRRSVLAVIWVLTTLVMFLSPRGEIDFNGRSFWSTPKSRNDPELDRRYKDASYICDQRGGATYWSMLLIAQILVVGLPVFWFICTTFVVTGFSIPGLRDNATLRRLGRVMHLLPAYLFVLVMWASLLSLQLYRQMIRINSGNQGDESTWGFGQILALFVWAPTIVEFLYILFWGLEDSISSHMPPKYQLSITRKTTEGVQTVRVHGEDYNEISMADDSQRDCEAGNYKKNAMAMSTAVTPPPEPQMAIANGFYAQDASGNWHGISQEQAAVTPGCVQVLNGHVLTRA